MRYRHFRRRAKQEVVDRVNPEGSYIGIASASVLTSHIFLRLAGRAPHDSESYPMKWTLTKDYGVLSLPTTKLMHPGRKMRRTRSFHYIFLYPNIAPSACLVFFPSSRPSVFYSTINNCTPIRKTGTKRVRIYEIGGTPTASLFTLRSPH